MSLPLDVGLFGASSAIPSCRPSCTSPSFSFQGSDLKVSLSKGNARHMLVHCHGKENTRQILVHSHFEENARQFWCMGTITLHGILFEGKVLPQVLCYTGLGTLAAGGTRSIGMNPG